MPALNELANKYANDLQIVVVFWDAGEFEENGKSIQLKIKICYAMRPRNDFKIVAI
jgi:hypothetical protein